MPTNTYVALATQTLGSAAASVTFSSISSTYTDLILVVEGTASTGAELFLEYNSDATTIYSYTVIYGTGSSALSTRETLKTGARAGYFDTNRGMFIAQIQNYSNATTYKSALSRNNVAATTVEAYISLWRSTSAINSVKIKTNTGTFSTGSTFSLYGIKAVGGDTTPKATGGVVTSDATYYYHTFAGSNTFTALQSLSADILCIAGGGGGGWQQGGGGGAGGLLDFTSQSLTATPYNVIVGGGGAGSTSSVRGTVGQDSQFGSLTLVKGGGGAGAFSSSGDTAVTYGGTGGSGGGGGTPPTGTGNGGSATSGQGNSGGNGNSDNATYRNGGGGGGAGGAGATPTSAATVGTGGAGSSAYSSWASVTSTGVSGAYAGGGGGGGNTAGTATAGGGRGGDASAGANGTASTGGGGGGGGYSSTVNAYNGGSGIVIVRYLKA